MIVYERQLMERTDQTGEGIVQNFWTEFPMVFAGLDPQNASPEQIFSFMEEELRSKLPHGQSKDEPLLSRYIDFSTYKDKKVLEIGYGTGWLMNELINAGARMHGIDLSHTHFELTKYRFRDIESVNIQVASAEEIPCQSKLFDAVFSWGVLHHASDDQKCFDEVFRVLKPGGKCFLMLYRKGGVKYWYQKIFKKGILRGGLIKNGFALRKFICSVTDVYSDASPGAPISRHYTRADLARLCRMFSKMELAITGTWGELDGIPFGKLPLSDWILTRKVRLKLLEKYGGFWLVYLTK